MRPLALMPNFLGTTIEMKTRSQSWRWIAPREPIVKITTPEKAHRVRHGVVKTLRRRDILNLYQ